MAERPRYLFRDNRFDLLRLEGLDSARPDAANIDNGVVWISTDTGDVSWAVNGAWVTHSTANSLMIATNWHLGNSVGAIAATATVQSQLYAILIRLPDEAATLTGLAAQVTTGAGSTNLRMGLYKVGTNGLPGALVVDGGLVASATTGPKTITALTAAVGGLKFAYVTCVAQGGTPSVNMADPANPVTPQSTANVANMLTGAYVPYLSAVTAALPDPFGTPSGYTALGPLVALQYS